MKIKYLLIALVIELFANTTMAQWVSSTYPIGFSSFDQLDFISKDTVWGTEFNGVVISYDGGKSFKRQNEMIVNNVSHIFNTNGHLFVVSNVLRKSTDLGITWMQVPIKNALGDTIYKSNIYQAHIFKNGNGFALGATNNSYRVFNTNNFGVNWVELDSSQINIPNFSNGVSPLFKGKQYCFDSSCITWNVREKNKFWVFNSFGVQTLEIDLNASISSDIRSFAFSDLHNGLIVTTDRNCYSYKGSSQSIELKSTAPASVAMDFAKSTNYLRSFFIIGNPSSPGSFITRDSGATWLPIEESHRHSFIKMFSDSIGISSINATNEPKVKSFEPLFTGIFNLVNRNQVFNLFPNPSRNEVELSGVLAHELQELSLFSLDGSLVQRFEPSLKLNLSAIQTGVYVLRISTQNAIGFLKVVKE